MSSPAIEIKRHVGQFVRLAVRCENCGHQAIVAVPLRSQYPRLFCGECGDRDPLIEPVRR